MSFKHTITAACLLVFGLPCLAQPIETSLTLQALHADKKGGDRHISGFLEPGGHAHGVPRRINLDHSEIGLAANLTPTLRAAVNIPFVDDSFVIEEAWLQHTAGGGLTLKAGRFLSGIGYANAHHPHAWDFADNNLMYEVLFGENLIQDGLQAKWVAPLDLFVELGVDHGRGKQFPGSKGEATTALFAHAGGDFGTSSSWRAGLSRVDARPKNRESHVDDEHEDKATARFTGNSTTWIADFVWKWAPGGDARSRYLKFQTEFFTRDERGAADCIGSTACDDGTLNDFRTRQRGGYAQAIWQFMPKFRVGVRHDRLESRSIKMGALPIELAVAKPEKWSLMGDYSPSETQRFRVQLSRDHSMQSSPDNRQVLLQYIHSFGTHAAHGF
jgi:hypothetical protein